MEFLTSLMSMLAAGSLLGVLGSTFLERLIPILPSYLLLLSIGVAAARFDGSLATMTSVSILGSVLGSSIYFYAAAGLGAGRAKRWGNRLGRLSGVSKPRMRHLLLAFRRNASKLSLVSQVVPGLRLVAPGMAGAMRIPPLTYFSFSAIGIAIWNLFFIGAGYYAALRNPQADAASIAVVVVSLFLTAEFVIAILWWARRRYRRMHAPKRSPSPSLLT